MFSLARPFVDNSLLLILGKRLAPFMSIPGPHPPFILIDKHHFDPEFGLRL